MKWPANDIIAAALGWHAPHLTPLVLLLVAGLILATVILYMPRRGTVRGGWRWLMVLLRVLALSALAVSILRPVIQRPPQPEDLGAIVILIDRSRGMGIVDRRSPAQLVALADGLGCLPPGVRTSSDDFTAALKRTAARLEELNYASMNAIARLPEATSAFDQAVAELLRHRTGMRPQSAAYAALTALQKLVDAGRSTGAAPDAKWFTAVHDALDRLAPAITAFQIEEDVRLYSTNKKVSSACDELKRLNRLGIVEQALLRPQTGLLYRLPPRVPAYGFAIGEKVEPLPLAGNGQPVRRLLLDPAGTPIDSSVAVRQALDQLHDVPVQAVILLAEGRHTAGEPVLASAAPVFAIASAPAAPGRDVSIEQTRVPSHAAVGEELTITGIVRGINLPRNARIDVHMATGETRTRPILAPSPRSIAMAAASAAIASSAIDASTQSLTLGDDGLASFSFTARFTHAGPQRISLYVDKLGAEINDDNNLIERWPNVTDEKIHAALIAGAPGWDFRQLRHLLQSNPGFAVNTYVLEEGGILPLSPEQILQNQLVVIYDLAANAMDARQWEALRRLVSERGGAVVLMAGPDHLPAEYLTAGPAADLLPFNTDKPPAGQTEIITNWQTWLGDQPVYEIVPATAAESMDALQLADTPQETHRRWNALPRIYEYLAIPPLKPGVTTLLVERASQAPVMTEHRLGAGRVLFSGMTETWRWRSKASRDQERFWSQLIAHLVDPPYAATVSSPAGRFSLDLPPAIAPGQAPPIRARLLNQDGSPFKIDEPQVRIVTGSTIIATISLAPAQPVPCGQFKGFLPALDRGQYQVELLAPGSASVAISRPLHVTARDELSAQDLVGNRQSLARLAEACGGEVLLLEQANTLPDRLAALRERESTPTTFPLWDSGYLFLFVVACLATEWGLRKRMGLA